MDFGNYPKIYVTVKIKRWREELERNLTAKSQGRRREE